MSETFCALRQLNPLPAYHPRQITHVKRDRCAIKHLRSMTVLLLSKDGSLWVAPLCVGVGRPIPIANA